MKVNGVLGTKLNYNYLSNRGYKSEMMWHHTSFLYLSLWHCMVIKFVNVKALICVYLPTD